MMPFAGLGESQGRAGFGAGVGSHVSQRHLLDTQVDVKKDCWIDEEHSRERQY